jgi:hypothetical protein
MGILVGVTLRFVTFKKKIGRISDGVLARFSRAESARSALASSNSQLSAGREISEIRA